MPNHLHRGTTSLALVFLSVAGAIGCRHPFLSPALLVAGAYVLIHLRRQFAGGEAVTRRALHDPLTGLPNHSLLTAMLAEPGSQNRAVALCMLDRFDRVGVELGFDAADRLFALCAARIDKAARALDGHVFRLDGTKLAIVLDTSQQPALLDNMVARLRKAIGASVLLDRQEILVTVSVGAAEAFDDTTPRDALLRKAATALATACAAGIGQYHRYSPELDARPCASLSLESALKHAIARHELALWYQPRQQLSDGSLAGFEALLRWQHDGRQVPPSEFIPLAEDSGIIVEIGDWVLGQACRQAALWRKSFGCPIPVAINISPKQFRHPRFLARVWSVLATSGANPADIEFEITEGMMMDQGEEVVRLLEALRDLGVAVSIDDFGTGYSSLSYLARLPVSRLKIDRSFVQGLDAGSRHASVVEAAIGLGHNLGLSVVAEGVETAAQRDQLARLSCDEIQGYLYARPLALDQADIFIAAERARIRKDLANRLSTP